MRIGLFDTVERQRDVVEYSRAVFSKIGKMGKGRPSIVVSTKALQGTPYPRECCEKSQETRVPRVALGRISPVIRIKAKEKLNILGVVSL